MKGLLFGDTYLSCLASKRMWLRGIDGENFGCSGMMVRLLSMTTFCFSLPPRLTMTNQFLRPITFLRFLNLHTNKHTYRDTRFSVNLTILFPFLILLFIISFYYYYFDPFSTDGQT